MKTAYFRFYEELNDFLPPEKRKIKFEHPFFCRASVKDIIESLGVPHTEIDLILVNGKSVDFSYIINDKDEISVYPVFESFDISEVQHLRPQPLREPKFIVDVHLGRLAKNLRMLGFDTLYKNNTKDNELIDISQKERRTIITKNREILKRNNVTHGYWIRSKTPEDTVIEIIKRFDLKNQIRELTRCLECNLLLKKTEKEKIADKIPAKVELRHNEFFICVDCNKIYWKGSHYNKMSALVKKILRVL